MDKILGHSDLSLVSQRCSVLTKLTLLLPPSNKNNSSSELFENIPPMNFIEHLRVKNLTCEQLLNLLNRTQKKVRHLYIESSPIAEHLSSRDLGKISDLCPDLRSLHIHMPLLGYDGISNASFYMRKKPIFPHVEFLSLDIYCHQLPPSMLVILYFLTPESLKAVEIRSMMSLDDLDWKHLLMSRFFRNAEAFMHRGLTYNPLNAFRVLCAAPRLLHTSLLGGFEQRIQLYDEFRISEKGYDQYKSENYNFWPEMPVEWENETTDIM